MWRSKNICSLTFFFTLVWLNGKVDWISPWNILLEIRHGGISINMYICDWLNISDITGITKNLNKTVIRYAKPYPHSKVPFRPRLFTTCSLVRSRNTVRKIISQGSIMISDIIFICYIACRWRQFDRLLTCMASGVPELYIWNNARYKHLDFHVLVS